MTKIDLNAAYDDFTQESLFTQVVKENITDTSEYETKDIKAAKKQFGTWKDINSLSDDLLKMYQDHYSDVLDSIDENINFYVVIDWSQMLQDDLYSGYFDILKCSDGQYVIYMTPEGITRSNLTKAV